MGEGRYIKSLAQTAERLSPLRTIILSQTNTQEIEIDENQNCRRDFAAIQKRRPRI